MEFSVFRKQMKHVYLPHSICFIYNRECGKSCQGMQTVFLRLLTLSARERDLPDIGSRHHQV
jgi:hypothetical protein